MQLEPAISSMHVVMFVIVRRVVLSDFGIASFFRVLSIAALLDHIIVCPIKNLRSACTLCGSRWPICGAASAPVVLASSENVFADDRVRKCAFSNRNLRKC